MTPEMSQTMASFARECFGILFTRGKFASEVLPTEDIEASIACILAWENDRKSDSGAFGKELEALLNRHSIENDSNTPDFILAEYLRQCLAAWNLAVAAREEWFDRKPGK